MGGGPWPPGPASTAPAVILNAVVDHTS
jgi:hypothetical protein